MVKVRKDWLAGMSDSYRHAHDRLLAAIVAGNPAFDTPLCRSVFARSCAAVSTDTVQAGRSLPGDADLMHQVGGDMFMCSLGMDGTALSLSRQAAGMEEGSDDHVRIIGDIERVSLMNTRLLELSDACNTVSKDLRANHQAADALEMAF